MIYIGADHGGFALKEDLKKFLRKEKIAFADVGPKKYDSEDDYPDYVKMAADRVAKNPDKNKGLLICRTGQGACFTANKFKGIRAALCWNEEIAKMSRRDEDANILCLPADYISAEAAEEIVRAWLETSFSFEPRHIRRLKKVKALE